MSISKQNISKQKDVAEKRFDSLDSRVSEQYIEMQNLRNLQWKPSNSYHATSRGRHLCDDPWIHLTEEQGERLDKLEDIFLNNLKLLEKDNQWYRKVILMRR